MDADLLSRYIIALTNLYGVVPEKKVVEVYNLYNIPRANLGDLEMSVSRMNLAAHLVTRKAGYFIKDYLIFEDRYLELLEEQGDIDFYIPGPEEILRYEDEFYFQSSKEFKDFESCLNDYFELEPSTHKQIVELLMMDCQLGFDIKSILSELERKRLNFESIVDRNNFMHAFKKICRTSRKWQYRGHTYNELYSGKRVNGVKEKFRKILKGS